MRFIIVQVGKNHEVSEEHSGSFIRIEEYSRKETSRNMLQAISSACCLYACAVINSS